MSSNKYKSACIGCDCDCDCDWLYNWTQSIIHPSKWQYNLNLFILVFIPLNAHVTQIVCFIINGTKRMVDVRRRKRSSRRRRRIRAERREREKNNIRPDFQSIYWYANQKHDRQTNHFECVYSDEHWEYLDVLCAYSYAGSALLCVRPDRRNEDWKIVRHTHPKTSYFKRPNWRKIYNSVCTAYNVHNYHHTQNRFGYFYNEDLIDLWLYWCTIILVPCVHVWHKHMCATFVKGKATTTASDDTWKRSYKNRIRSHVQIQAYTQ